ncbi:MAG: hypothetical protein Q8Q78_14375 [Hydrogenophaga sp.]|nr:hypothetical protein [Hydrogenophaga sp.]
MLGLTALGLIHTIISLVAVATGFYTIFRDGRIENDNRLAQFYIWTTVLTCLTGFGIFEHGGFGKPHVLGVVTLLVIVLTFLPGQRFFGSVWRYVVTVSYSLTLFFHMIPAVTETFTRIPARSPLFTGHDDPALQPVFGTLFFVFLVGACIQIWSLRGASKGRTRSGALG